jgi:peptidoglycan/xylan/chitin deacetylase (PgdA/CDA1 family)
MQQGIFTISLDFELHWGGVEKRTLPEYNQYFQNTREVIPRMLELFNEYGIHVTWATVGMLFHPSLRDLFAHAPKRRPLYEDSTISTYRYIAKELPEGGEQELPFHFAPSLIELIKATPNQEIGTHTYSHYYCNEPGQTVVDFRADLRAAVQVACTKGVQLRSLVFPRNQFNKDYLKVCYDEGIRVVRSNPMNWFWEISRPADETPWKRLNRGADAYLPISHTSYSLADLKIEKDLPLSLPASRFLRPYDPRLKNLNEIRIRRIMGEMAKAAEKGEVYHLWWHPHNFGSHPKQSLRSLKAILEKYRSLRDRKGFTSMNMAEIYQHIHD